MEKIMSILDHKAVTTWSPPLWSRAITHHKGLLADPCGARQLVWGALVSQKAETKLIKPESLLAGGLRMQIQSDTCWQWTVGTACQRLWYGFRIIIPNCLKKCHSQRKKERLKTLLLYFSLTEFSVSLSQWLYPEYKLKLYQYVKVTYSKCHFSAR